MSQLQARAAARLPVAPQSGLPCVDDVVAVHRPSDPLLCLRPATLRQDAATFVAAFPGDVLYAVKCNPDPAVLRALYEGGLRHFDCASIGEIRVVRSLFPDAAIHFMHPVKSRAAIAEAYAVHGVRDFVLDSADELEKILQETGHAQDLGLVVRLALPPGGAYYDLSGKFGAVPDEAAALLRAARPNAVRLGMSFHVGSQCTDPLAWRRAINLAGSVLNDAGVVLDVLDVGGGFPAPYPGMDVPPLGAFMAEIEAAVDALDLPYAPTLWAEPGRALVAAGTSVVVQVQGRRNRDLFINDGIYGSLSDAGAAGFRYPTRLLRDSLAATEGFSFFGPTCDSLDAMRGPFVLPNDVREGDWIEIGQLGAYGAALRTGFNGFAPAAQVDVRDAPLVA
jgi:ornithine decarboxylase